MTFDEHYSRIWALNSELSEAIKAAATDGINVSITVESHGRTHPHGGSYSTPQMTMSRSLPGSHPHRPSKR